MNHKRPVADPGTQCPLYQRDVSEVCHKCAWYIYVRGMNPNAAHEEYIDTWGCSISWLPSLAIEGARQTRQAGAAIESFRNETLRAASHFSDKMDRPQAPAIEVRPSRLSKLLGRG